jgi:hypothetical protein
VTIVPRAFVHAVVLVSLATLAQARGNLKELTVPLKFIPQEGVHESSADLPPKLLNQSFEIRVEDARKFDYPLLIRQRAGGTDKRFPIHADHDVASFVQEIRHPLDFDCNFSYHTGAIVLDPRWSLR